MWISAMGDPTTAAILTIMLFCQPLQSAYAPQHSPMVHEGLRSGLTMGSNSDHGTDFGAKRDLASILQDPPLQQHERLSEALQILHPIQSGPRCHYHAALNLLNDCKFLESAPE